MTRKTAQKRMVYDAVRAAKTHPTCQDVCAEIRGVYPDISLGTVYRNLGIMADRGEILRLAVPGSADRFDSNISAHYHIVCRSCGRFEDVGMEYMADIDKMVERATGYRLPEGQNLVFSGTCPECAKGQSDKVDSH